MMAGNLYWTSSAYHRIVSPFEGADESSRIARDTFEVLHQPGQLPTTMQQLERRADARCLL